MDIDKQLIDKALELKPKERFVLIEMLVQSLDKPDPCIDEIWLKEAEVRLKAHREEKSKGIPAEKVLEKRGRVLISDYRKGNALINKGTKHLFNITPDVLFRQ